MARSWCWSRPSFCADISIQSTHRHSPDCMSRYSAMWRSRACAPWSCWWSGASPAWAMDSCQAFHSARLAEWKIGLRHFGYFLVAGIPLAWATRLVRLGPGMPMWKIAATFVGVLWVVALSEEFFFRGLLQQWMVRWTGRPAWALAGASILFGAVHLGFRGFPNWRFALAAAVAGWFYGRAYQQTQSIRASMVTHALVVTLWRAWFV